jgi:hypothetical protein
MHNYRFLSAVLLAIALYNAAAGQTLELTSTSDNPFDTRLICDKNVVNKTVSFQGKDKLVLSIVAKPGMKVVIANTEGNRKELVLTDFSHPYIFVANELKQPPYTLPDIFELAVISEQSKEIRKFILKKTAATRPAKKDTSSARQEKENAVAKPTTQPAYQAGSIINDAIYLAGHTDSTAKSILNYYSGESGLSDNKFLAGLLAQFEDTLAFAQNGNLGSITNLINAAGNANVTTLADGFAKFIVKRVKAELSITFFRKFKEELAKYPDLETVFPHTVSILNSIDEEIYNYSNYINNLREAFQSDIETIDQTLPGIIDNHEDYFKKKHHYDLAIAVRTGCYIAGSIKSNMHPGDILDAYPTRFFDDAEGEEKDRLLPVKGAVQCLQLLSESLIENDSTKKSYWVGFDKIRALAQNEKALKIYIGLVLQRAKSKYDNVVFSKEQNLYDILNQQSIADNFSKDYNAYKNFLLNLGNKVRELDQMVKDFSQLSSDSLKIEQYAKYFSATNQLLAYCFELGKLPHLEKVEVLSKLQVRTRKYFDINLEVSDLAVAILRRKYPSAINHVVAIYNDIAGTASTTATSPKLSRKEKLALAENVLEKSATAPGTTIGSIVRPADRAADSSLLPPPGRVTTLLAKYGAFMSNMINAKSSDDVAKAIEDAALPTGSARIKRETAFNVALNAYCGLFIGHEKINSVTDNQAFNAYGLTAPIGVSASIGTKKGTSHSLFVSLVDLGAVAAFRFTDNTTEQVPTIQLKDIFSPGVFYSLGIPKSPISINMGVQVGPNLRKVTKDANDYSGKTYVRYSLSFCVDIPVFNLYTKPR